MKKIVIILISILLFIGIFEIWKIYNINQKQVAVLVYHDIVENDELKAKNRDNLTTTDFEEQVKYLKDVGYTSISLDELYDWKIGKSDISEKSVVLTFDDGYYSFKYLVQPILQKYDYKAACFLIGNVTGEKTPEYHEGVYGTIGMDEVNNHIENVAYGSHTYNLHDEADDGKPMMYKKSLEDLRQDAKNFRNNLFDAKYLAYPFYTYSKDFVKSLEQENYKLAFAGEEEMATKGIDNLTVPRISAIKDINTFKEIFETNKFKNSLGNGLIRKVVKTLKRIIGLNG